MDDRLKEIRRVLGGMYVYVTANVITSAKNLLEVQSTGRLLAFVRTRLRGIREFRVQYRIPGDLAAGQDACVRSALRLGSQVLLSTAPETLAVLHWPVLRKPAVLTAESRDDSLLLCCVTVKSLFAKRNADRMFAAWLDGMEGLAEKTAVTMQPQCLSAEEPAKQKRQKTKEKTKPNA